MKDWPSDEEQPEDGLGPYYGHNAMYAFSTTILPEYQGKAYGKILKSYCLGLWKARGFDLALGHARDGISIKLQQSFGADVVETFPMWYKTEETYYLYLQKL